MVQVGNTEYISEHNLSTIPRMRITLNENDKVIKIHCSSLVTITQFESFIQDVIDKRNVRLVD